MKQLLTFFILFSTTTVNAQTIFPINKDGEIEYTNVVNVDSLDSKKLYKRGKMVLATIFNSAKTVIQNDDDENKQVLLQASIKADYKYNGGFGNCAGVVNFIMLVEYKDNKYRYSIKPTVHDCYGCSFNCSGGSLLNEFPSCGKLNMTKANWDRIKSNANDEFKTFINRFETMMNKAENNDW